MCVDVFNGCVSLKFFIGMSNMETQRQMRDIYPKLCERLVTISKRGSRRLGDPFRKSIPFWGFLTDKRNQNFNHVEFLFRFLNEYFALIFVNCLVNRDEWRTFSDILSGHFSTFELLNGNSWKKGRRIFFYYYLVWQIYYRESENIFYEKITKN